MMSVLMWRYCLSKLLLSGPRVRALGLCTFFLWLPLILTAGEHRHSFELATTCPAGFKLTEERRCKLNSLYNNYRSPHDSGVGGPRAGLPKIRDGFSPQVIDLGRYLFFDPLLSADNSIACSSCHDPDYGFADGLGRARGINKAVLDRSAPSLWNIGFFDTLLWDGSKSSLEEQLIGPLYADNEMGNRPDQLIAELRSNAIYRDLFTVAFGPGEIQLDQVYTAITAFESSLVSLNSRYDFYAHGLQTALSPSELEGLNVFRSFVSRCGECHTPPLFSNQEIAIVGVPEPQGRPFDPGAGASSGIPSQRGGLGFRAYATLQKQRPICTRATSNHSWIPLRSITVGEAMQSLMTRIY